MKAAKVEERDKQGLWTHESKGPIPDQERQGAQYGTNAQRERVESGVVVHVMAANEQRWSCVSSDGVGVCKERMGGMGWLALRTEAHLCVGSREQSVSVARAEERAATARGIARTTRTGREQRTVVLESVDGELFVRGVGLSKPLLPEVV